MRGPDYKTNKMFEQMDKALQTILQTDPDLKKHMEGIANDAGVPLSYVVLCSLWFAMKKVKNAQKYQYESICTRLRTDFVNYFMARTELKSDN